MYNQYNPYLNRFYGQQQANLPQPMELPQQTQNVPLMKWFNNNVCKSLIGIAIFSTPSKFDNK